jgi:hypothetical protein
MSSQPALSKGQIAISPASQLVVPILGMHRAGGSLVARLMNLMGMELGWPLQPVSQDNPRGFWEHLLFQGINMQLLNGFGCHQDAFGTPEALGQFAKQMAMTDLSEEDRGHLAERIGRAFMQPVWGWKDPRTALTWPFWSKLLAEIGYHQVKPVVVVRHPDACLRSLRKWGHSRGPAAAAGMSEEDFVHSMWWGFYRAVLDSDLDETQTAVICTEDLLDPETAPLEIARLADHMGAHPERCQAALDWIEFSGASRDPVPEDPHLASLYKGLCGIAQEQRERFTASTPVALTLVRAADHTAPEASIADYCIYQVSPLGYPHTAAFDEVALALHHGFEALGIHAPLVTRIEDVQGTPVVVGVNLIGRFVDTLKVADQLPEDAILFNLEQIDRNSPWMTDAYLELLKRFRVWDYSPYNVVRLQGMGIVVEGVCGIGHVKELERIDQSVEEDIDVLFYGGLNDRRVAILDALRTRGLNVVVAANCYGEARDQLVARAKVVLNIHFYEAKVLEMVRISYLLANGQCVVSETGVDREEEAIFQDAIAFRPYAELVDACVDLVQDAPQRERIAAQAKSLFSSMKQSDFLAERLK